jgi:hypothetical protein
MRRLVQLFIPCVFLSGCFGPGEGVEVPQDQIYFPVGLALDKGARHLFVVSSDFDLQFNGGAVQSYDLDALHEALPRVCNENADCGGTACEAGLCLLSGKETPCPQGDRAGADRLLFPGRCNAIDPTLLHLQVDKVKIGAFATDAILRERPDTDELGEPILDTAGHQVPDGGTDLAPERLFVPVRGDSTLHWLDVTTDGLLQCGQSNNAGACDDAHRAGDDPTENTRGIKLNAEPFAIDADESGRTIAVTNQTTGTASLFVNDWKAPDGPQLRFALASSSIPSRPVGIAAVPRVAADVGKDPDDAFMMTFRNSAQVRLFRFAPDGQSAPDRQFLVDGGGVAIDANSVGSDSRGIAIDPSTRKRAEAACNGDAACLQTAALVPLDVYVANRSPSSLLIGRSRPPLEYPYFFQALPLTTGPSRVVVGQVQTPAGELETRVFVACFDSRRIFVYDPLRSRIETEILTGRGPHAVAVDPTRKLLYVGHFTDSYVGVYSLDLASPATYGTLLGTLGTPKAPRSSK